MVDHFEQIITVLLLGLALAWRLWRRLRRRKSRRLHSRNQAAAYRRLDKIARPEFAAAPGRILAYLRTIDPFVFEEMILHALQRRGLQAIRNTRYTGDGGIDGRVVLEGRKTLIQAKRYSRHIDAAHVAAFAAICRKEDAWGLFIHTGRTGCSAWAAGSDPRIDIVSGERLINLLLGRPVTLCGVQH